MTIREQLLHIQNLVTQALNDLDQDPETDTFNTWLQTNPGPHEIRRGHNRYVAETGQFIGEKNFRLNLLNRGYVKYYQKDAQRYYAPGTGPWNTDVEYPVPFTH